MNRHRPRRAGPQHKRHLKAVSKPTLTVAELAAFDALRPREDLAALAAKWADDAEFQALLKLAQQPLPELDDDPVLDVLTASAHLPDGVYRYGRRRTLRIQRAKAQVGLATMRQLERAALTASAARKRTASQALVPYRGAARSATVATAPVEDSGAQLLRLLGRAVDALAEIASKPPAPAPIVNVAPPPPTIEVHPPPPAQVAVHVPPSEKKPAKIRASSYKGYKIFEPLDEFGNVIGSPTGDTAA